MTYCIAWKDEKNVFIVADTAVSTKTLSEGDNLDTTSFGDLEEKKQDYYVYERKLKVHTINNQYLIGYSGNLDQINEVYPTLEMLLIQGVNITDALTYISNSYDYKECKFLIGYLEDKIPKLLQFDCKDIIYGDFFQIGSGVANQRWVMRNKEMLKYIEDESLTPEQSLTSIITLLQFYSLKERMIELGVGGVIFGARINLGGIFWCNDITYYIYNDHFNNYNLVTVIERDNNVAVFSSFNDKMLIFLGNENINTEISDEYLESVEEILTITETKYFVFMSVFYPGITILDINYNVHNNLFRMYFKIDEKFNYRFILTEELFDIIMGRYIPSDEIILMQWIYTSEVEYISLKDLIISRGHESIVPDYDDENYI
ncbi:hypothetical protein [Haloplasma contractile]|uniref:Uncharacterized protein n=1 Tax=Haloplasma contractile SSD-17B TaxID=1033810 RepID=F7PVU2_9MOLU|nr:hypothetical protein [Haloplasma contractile]ERJ12736.1 hypothetical protein HLPCO_001076 [Haloplasma contractile SSD-17B]